MGHPLLLPLNPALYKTGNDFNPLFSLKMDSLAASSQKTVAALSRK